MPPPSQPDQPALPVRTDPSGPSGNPGSVLAVVAFFTATLFVLSPFASPPIALAVGLFLALTTGNPFMERTPRITKWLLQISVVGLGFGINIAQVAKAGRQGFLFTAATIAGTLIAGYALGRWLRVEPTTAQLVSAGTAICGGSAIAAMASVIDAEEQPVSVALGTVFILNAVGLFLFPPVGRLLFLSQTQFGIWSAVAIHDTSSVVGAASNYGAAALAIATTVKLTRALWIVPMVVAFSFARRRQARLATFPWFILVFLVASIAGTFLPAVSAIAPTLVQLAKIGLTFTLFLIGAGLSRRSIAAVGFRPLLLGLLLWLLVSSLTLWAVLSTVSGADAL